jgi:hypothetical protein
MKDLRLIGTSTNEFMVITTADAVTSAIVSN